MRRPILGLGLAALLAACAGAASATIMQATYTGVGSAGLTDDGAFFGAAGASLAGEAYTLTFLYDTTIGATGPNEVIGGSALGGAPNPVSKVRLTFGGVSFDVTPDYFSTVSSTPSQYSHSAQGANTDIVAYYNGLGVHDLTDSITASDPSAGSVFIDLFAPVLPDTRGNLDVASFDVRPFTGGAAVPEPAAWTLMIAGFGLAGAALRRRRARPAVAV